MQLSLLDLAQVTVSQTPLLHLKEGFSADFFKDLSLTGSVDRSWKSRHPFPCLEMFEQPALSLALPLTLGQFDSSFQQTWARFALPYVAVLGQRPRAAAGQGLQRRRQRSASTVPRLQATGSSRTSLCCFYGPGPRKHLRARAMPPPLAGVALWGDALFEPQILVASYASNPISFPLPK